MKITLDKIDLTEAEAKHFSNYLHLLGTSSEGLSLQTKFRNALLDATNEAYVSNSSKKFARSCVEPMPSILTNYPSRN